MDSRSLPEIIPVFPLTGVLLLPGMVLPLQIFEERYRNMLADAQAGEGWIGMVQPKSPRQDNRPTPGSELDIPELYPVGCLGRLEKSKKAAEGSYLVALRGVSRFRIRKEMDSHQGYRRVATDYSGFEGDGKEEQTPFEATRLVLAVREWAIAQGMDVEKANFAGLEGTSALNGLAMTLPLAPAEKQALLEAPSLAEREQIMLGLLRMGIEEVRDDGNVVSPTLN